jgi:hypothetical protein
LSKLNQSLYIFYHALTVKKSTLGFSGGDRKTLLVDVEEDVDLSKNEASKDRPIGHKASNTDLR